jgi:hypothetical protein
MTAAAAQPQSRIARDSLITCLLITCLAWMDVMGSRRADTLVLMRLFCPMQKFVGMLGKISLQELIKCMQAAPKSGTQFPSF